MSAIIELLLAYTDPGTALLIVLLGVYVRSKMDSIEQQVDRVRQRVGRVEDVYIPDGGQIEDE